MKKILLCLVLLLFFVLPAYSIGQVDLVRVGITDNNFQNVLKQDIKLYATAEATICDKETRRMLINIPANTDIAVKNTLLPQLPKSKATLPKEQVNTLHKQLLLQPNALILSDRPFQLFYFFYPRYSSLFFQGK